MLPDLQIICGDAREKLPELPAASVQCCVTSPPYWQLRDYGVAGQIGMEETVDDYVDTLATVFAQVWRVLKDDGTLWLNLGDCYAGGGNGGGGSFATDGIRAAKPGSDKNVPARKGCRGVVGEFKEKDLVGVPWMVAFALRSAGWYLRADVIWSKPNPMPESVTDRPTKAHEYIFLLTKQKKYYYDYEAIKEQPSPALIKQVEEGYNGESTKDFAGGKAQDASGTKSRIIANARKRIDKQRGHSRRHAGFNARWDKMSVAEQHLLGSNKRSVWQVATRAYTGAHFATFPPDLIKPCILAGSRPGDTILDPFGGSGTTAEVALGLGRSAILCELNPDYVELARSRTNTVVPGLGI